MNKAIIYGAAGAAKIFYYDVKNYGDIEIAAFCVDRRYRIADEFCGLPIVDFETVTDVYPIDEYKMFVLCGYSRMRERETMYLKAKAKGYTLGNYISPRAAVDTIPVMGDNNIIMANSYIGFNGKMGSNNIIRQNVYLGHEFTLGNHNIISAGCVFGGNTTIKNLSFFGLGATGKNGLIFGEEALVGMGSNVVRNVPDWATVLGNPAKVISTHEEEGIIIPEEQEWRR